MKYVVEIRPRAVKDLKSIHAEQSRMILDKIRDLENNLAGDVKRLASFDIGYRLRIGDYRVLFDVESDRVIIRRIKHRREAYRQR
jgi:mRNA interferase RelE/StbE